MKKNRTLFSIDEQGQLHFNSRSERVKERHQPDSFWDRPFFLIVVISVCALIDYAVFVQLFSAFLYDSPFIRAMSTGAMIVGFDILPLYLGKDLRRRVSGYNVSKPIIILMIMCFSIAFVINVYLRISFKDLVMTNLTSNSGSVYGSVNLETVSPRALPYALFTSILPLITSIASFAISYSMSNPLADEVKKLEKEKNMLLDNIGYLEACLTEYAAEPNFLERVKAEDSAKYDAMQRTINIQIDTYRSYVLQKLKEHVGTPAANSALSQSLKIIDVMADSELENDGTRSHPSTK